VILVEKASVSWSDCLRDWKQEGGKKKSHAGYHNCSATLTREGTKNHVTKRFPATGVLSNVAGASSILVHQTNFPFTSALSLTLSPFSTGTTMAQTPRDPTLREQQIGKADINIAV